MRHIGVDADLSTLISCVFVHQPSCFGFFPTFLELLGLCSAFPDGFHGGEDEGVVGEASEAIGEGVEDLG